MKQNIQNTNQQQTKQQQQQHQQQLFPVLNPKQQFVWNCDGSLLCESSMCEFHVRVMFMHFVCEFYACVLFVSSMCEFYV